LGLYFLRRRGYNISRMKTLTSLKMHKYGEYWHARAPAAMRLRARGGGKILLKRQGEVILWRPAARKRCLRHVYLLPCACCGTWTIALRRDRRYCSAACRMRLYRQRRRASSARIRVTPPPEEWQPGGYRWCIEDYLLEEMCGIKMRPPPPLEKP